MDNGIYIKKELKQCNLLEYLELEVEIIYKDKKIINGLKSKFSVVILVQSMNTIK